MANIAIQDSPEMTKLKESLQGFIGSEQMHIVNPFRRKFIVSDGIKEYLTNGKCFYLSDKLATEAFEQIVKYPYDTYYCIIKVEEPSGKMTIEVKDWTDKVIYTGDYRASTHPTGEMKTILGWDGTYVVWCLISEN